MSLHVYIANEGFKDNPIPAEAWLAAARQHRGLDVKEHTNRRGQVIYQVHLKNNQSARLELDRYGLVHTQAPGKDLIVVMFDLAAALGARVYSEKLKPYHSPGDWEKRTREFRQHYEARRADQRKIRRRWIALTVVLLLLIVSGGIGGLIEGS